MMFRYVIGIAVVLIGVLIGTSPPGVTPPATPEGSATLALPPWPIFRVAIALNEFFEAAAWATRPPPVQVKSLGTAYWQSEVAYALTVNGVIDLLGASEGGAAVGCATVAKDLKLKVDFLCRMMRAGEGIKLLSSADDGQSFALTAAGELLRSDHPNSLRAFMLMINEETREAWRAVGTTSLKTGESGFKSAYGEEFWQWHSRDENEDKMTQFDQAMKSFSQEISGSLLVDWQPRKQDAVVCDVGGGMGHMAVAMAHHYPNLKGIVFDLPAVAERAHQNIKQAGLVDRITTVGGSFLDDELPSELSKCDVFYLKFILHDWSDEVCVTILSNLLKVAKAGAEIATTDFVLNTDERTWR